MVDTPGYLERCTDDKVEQASKQVVYHIVRTRKKSTNNESSDGQTLYEEWESDDRNKMG